MLTVDGMCFIIVSVMQFADGLFFVCFVHYVLLIDSGGSFFILTNTRILINKYNISICRNFMPVT